MDENIQNTKNNIFKKNNNIILNLNNLIIKNNLSFDNCFPSIIEKKFNELSFLNNKRIPSNNSRNNIHNLQDIYENSSDNIKNQFNLLKNLKKENTIYKNYSRKKEYPYFMNFNLIQLYGKNDKNFCFKKSFKSIVTYEIFKFQIFQ